MAEACGGGQSYRGIVEYGSSETVVEYGSSETYRSLGSTLSAPIPPLTRSDSDGARAYGERVGSLGGRPKIDRHKVLTAKDITPELHAAAKDFVHSMGQSKKRRRQEL